MTILTPTKARSIAAGLTQTGRDILVAHISSQHVPIRLDRHQSKSLNGLMDRGLVRYKGWSRSRSTLITEDGRAVLCALLGIYAEALVKAGYRLPESPSGGPELPRGLILEITNPDPPFQPGAGPSGGGPTAQNRAG